MKIEKLNTADSKILKRIQDSIPKDWLDCLVEKVPVAPNMKEACERAINDKDISDDIKKKAQMMLDSGLLDKTIEKVNPYFEKLINSFIDREISASVKRGELPKGKKHRNLDKKLKRIIKAKK